MSPEIIVKHEDGRVETVSVDKDTAAEAAAALMMNDMHIRSAGFNGLTKNVKEGLVKLAMALNIVKA